MARRPQYGLTTIILLLYFGLRLHDLLALPLFIDETLHAQRAESVWQGSPLWFGVHGKYLGAWWAALFQPFLGAAPWLIRASVLLLTLLSAAAVMALAQRLFGRAASLWAGVLLIFAPMLFFFDRMSLADTILHPMLALFVLSLFHLTDAPAFRRKWALLTGAALALAVLAKATALMIVPLPLIAVFILPRGWRAADRLKSLAWLFGTALLLWLPLLVLMRLRHINYLGVPLAEHSASSGDLWLLERVVGNARFLLDGLVAYFGVAALALAGLAMILAIIARSRRGTILALAVGGPSLAIILTGNDSVSLRYWVGVLPLALGLVAGGLASLARWISPRVAFLVAGLLVALWLVVAATPFVQTAYTDPIALPLPAKDRLEYLESDSAGTMLPELAAFLMSENVRLGGHLVVSGAISQCYGLSLYLPRDSQITLDCPRVFSPEGRGAALDQHITALADENPHFYAIFEQPGLTSATYVTSIPLEPVAEFPRPGGRVTITVYRPAATP